MRNQTNKHYFKTGWKALLGSLIGATAILTMSVLILPGIAMEEGCPLPEHQHTEECYQLVEAAPNSQGESILPTESDENTVLLKEGEEGLQPQAETEQLTEKRLICGYEEHIHTEECEGKKTEPDTAGQQQDSQQNVEVPPVLEEQSALDNQSAPEIENKVDKEVPEVPSDSALQQDLVQNAAAEPAIAVEQYINRADLKYKEKGGTAWQDSTTGVPIPGNAKLHLEIGYQEISLKQLIDKGGRLDFEIPTIMRNPVAQGDINSGGAVVGQMSVNGKTLEIAFKVDWLEELQKNGDENLHGEFYVESDINLAVIPGEGGPTDIVLGNVTLKPTFDSDVVAKYGEIAVEKTVSQHIEGDDGAHYLEYTLTVQTGEDSMPSVKVVDYFTINGKYVQYQNITPQPKTLTESGDPREQVSAGVPHGEIYKGKIPTDDASIPEPNQQGITEPGSVVWNIGVMQPYEQRILTYRVKLSDKQTLLDNPLQNEAKIYSKTYKRDHDVVDFKPQADLELQKSHTEPERNPVDGSYKITYTVSFTTPSSNNHVLKNLEIIDMLNDKEHGTNPKALQYIHYDKNSFRLYHSKNPQGEPIEVNRPNALPTLVYGADDKSFTLTMGNLKPGESYCFQYDLKITAEAFAAGNLEELMVKNRAKAKADNAHLPDKDYLQKSDDQSNIKYPNWIKKAAGQPLDTEQSISLGEHIYDATGGAIQPDTTKPKSFTVPKGSFRYTVDINKLGDFDVTKTHVKDVLKSKYMAYAGYMQIDAYDTAGQTEEQLGTLVETRWLKIDKMTTFDIVLEKVGFAPGSYAYRLTYYGTPVNVENISQVNAVNTINISGPVGKNGQYIQINGFDSQVEVTVQGGHAFEIQKKAWYYEESQKTNRKWENGSIYWGIKIDGTQLHKGTFIKDHTKKEWLNGERGTLYFHEDSFVGAYMGTLPDNTSFTDFGTLQSLLDGKYFTELPKSSYKVTYGRELDISPENTYDAIVTEILEPIAIPQGSSIYLIVKGEPNELPQDNRAVKKYTNYVSTSSNGRDYLQQGLDTKNLYGGQNIMKEFGKFSEFDGETIKDIDVHQWQHNIPLHLLKQNGKKGHFLGWTVKVNYAGDLAGHYRIVDDIPQGTELAFARMKWQGESTRYDNVRMQQIPDYKTVLGPEWTEYSVTAGMDEMPPQNKYTSFYYSNGKQVLWETDNLIAGHQQDVYAIDFQVVCRITDPDVLLGGMNKEFLNHAYLQDAKGNPLDSDSNGFSAKIKNISKNMLEKGNKIHYTIELNPTGEDMHPTEDTITLIDEMSETLRLNLESLKVFRTNSQPEELIDFVPTFDKSTNTLSMVLPDAIPLTIQYIADVQAKPNTTVKLSNKAYWKGYSSEGGDEAVNDSFYYAVGGTAGSSKNPFVRVVKHDADNLTEKLQGAEFQMEEGKMEQGSFVATGRVWNGITAEDGVAVLGKDAANNMKFNTVYRIKETKAPHGYVKSDEEYLFLIATKENGKYPNYPDGVFVEYNDSVYTMSVENEKGRAYLRKQFQKVDGTPAALIPGTYTFGLFDNQEGSGTPIQEIVLEILEGATDAQGVFEGLDADKTYYVFELDDNKKPIHSKQFGQINSIPFQVEYQSDFGFGSVHGVGNGATITITNRLTMEAMPETGGRGSLPYEIAGLALMAVSATALVCGKKQKKHKETIVK